MQYATLIHRNALSSSHPARSIVGQLCIHEVGRTRAGKFLLNVNIISIPLNLTAGVFRLSNLQKERVSQRHTGGRTMDNHKLDATASLETICPIGIACTRPH